MKSILEQVQDRYDKDSDAQELFVAYDDMDCMRWNPPTNLLKDWVRVRKNTSPHDALKQMSNIFDTYNPKWEILPLGEADTDKAEELETWLDWTAAKANSIGEFSPFRKALYDSGKYNRVVLHVDYLPYWLPKDKSKWTPEQKADAQNGPFCITAEEIRCMYYEIGKYGLKWIANVGNHDGQEIIDKWSIYESDTDEGKQIKRGLAKIKSLLEEDGCYFVYLDYTSHEKRYVAAFKTSEEGTADFCGYEEDDAIVILDAKNDLGFIPYAVATGDSDALLHSLHVGGIWENQNLIDTIVDSSVLRRAFFPLIKHQSMTGKELDINYDGSQDVVELGQGEDAQSLVPPPIDSGLQQLAQSNSMKMGQAVGIRNLGLTDIAGNVQYSTVQAQIQLQLTALQPYKRTAEKVLTQVAYLMFRWIKKYGKGELAYRSQKRVKKDGQVVGEQLLVGPDDFDPDVMQITCALQSNTPTDRQQLVNMLVSLKQAGAAIPWTDIIDLLQMFGNPELLKGRFVDEQIEGAVLQNFVAEMQQQLQLKGQAQIMQQQDAVQAEGGGVDAAMGGEPSMMSNPGLTRNQVRNPG